MANTKTTGLTEDTDPQPSDLLYTVDDPGGTPSSKKALISNVVGYMVTTAGDIVYATASRVLARLGIGTAGQVLGVNSGATAPEWVDKPNDNLLINGGFDIWQRGTSFAVTNGINIYTADRFKVKNYAAGVDFTVDKLAITDLPGSTYALKTSYDTAPGASEQGRQRVIYTLESADARKLAGKILTFTFKCKSSQGMTSVQIYSQYNTTGVATENDTSTAISDTTVNINTSTWTTCSLTFTVPALATLGTSGTFGVEIAARKSTGEAQFDGIQVSQAKLEVGAVATPYVQRQYGDELALCQRYARSSSFYIPATTAQSETIDMRVTPTITGGGAGYTSTGTTASAIVHYQTTGAVATLLLTAEL